MTHRALPSRTLADRPDPRQTGAPTARETPHQSNTSRGRVRSPPSRGGHGRYRPARRATGAGARVPFPELARAPGVRGGCDRRTARRATAGPRRAAGSRGPPRAVQQNQHATLEQVNCPRDDARWFSVLKQPLRIWNHGSAGLTRPDDDPVEADPSLQRHQRHGPADQHCTIPAAVWP